MKNYLLQIVGCLIILGSPPDSIDLTGQWKNSSFLYLPTVNQPVITPVPYRNNCGLNELEEKLFLLVLNHPDQQRNQLLCDPILSVTARARASDMAIRNYFDHVNPEGFGPNYMAQWTGFDVPDNYLSVVSLNYIESMAAGTTTPQHTFDLLMNSPGHKSHLMAENEFFRRQDRIGVGVVEDASSFYGFYWVILISERKR